MFIQDYFNYLESEAPEHSPLVQCKDMLFKVFHSYKKMLSRDEYEDLQTDILVIALEAEQTYDPVYGASFSTYLHTRLKKLSHEFLTKYSGIKVTEHTRSVVYKGQKIYINKTEYKED